MTEITIEMHVVIEIVSKTQGKTITIHAFLFRCYVDLKLRTCLMLKFYYNDIHVLYNTTYWNHCTMSEVLIISGGVFLKQIWSGYLLFDRQQSWCLWRKGRGSPLLNLCLLSNLRKKSIKNFIRSVRNCLLRHADMVTKRSFNLSKLLKE